MVVVTVQECQRVLRSRVGGSNSRVERRHNLACNIEFRMVDVDSVVDDRDGRAPAPGDRPGCGHVGMGVDDPSVDHSLPQMPLSIVSGPALPLSDQLRMAHVDIRPFQ